MTMKAMVLEAQGQPLVLRQLPVPRPGEDDVLIRVRTCAVCRTDLHVIDGDLDKPKLPLVPGHEIIGIVAGVGRRVQKFEIGDRVGVPWLGGTCGRCSSCMSGRENLCDSPVFTGYSRDGGFAEFCVADHRFCFPISPVYDDMAAAPLMCAGLIGYRSLRKTGEARRLGLYGFGAAAHIVVQVAVYQGREVYAFTKPDDRRSQDFARSLGARWAGGSDVGPPAALDAAILFAPVGALVPAALQAVGKGGRVICAGIHMSDIPSFPYKYLWEERHLESVANLTRQDGSEFLEIAPKVPVHTRTVSYPLAEANRALSDLRSGAFDGAAVLSVSDA